MAMPFKDSPSQIEANEYFSAIGDLAEEYNKLEGSPLPNDILIKHKAHISTLITQLEERLELLRAKGVTPGARH
jgi:hypothetical protein